MIHQRIQDFFKNFSLLFQSAFGRGEAKSPIVIGYEVLILVAHKGRAPMSNGKGCIPLTALDKGVSLAFLLGG